MECKIGTREKTALITGITGQDGSYLAELLLSKGYQVHGLVRRVALEDQAVRLHRIVHARDRLVLHTGCIDSFPSIFRLLNHQRIDECYHLAAQSYVGEELEDGIATINVNIGGTHYLLASIKELQPECRFYFAGSSEMFGRCAESPQNESTRFHPRNPYGISKVAGFELTRSFRESYGMYCCTGILYNHESPRRGAEFVTRKIARAAARISRGLEDHLLLGSLDAKRDWGHAKDYVRAMHLMLQCDEPDDYVVATGVSHSVRDFCRIAFEEVGLDYQQFVRTDERLVRPVEAVPLVGDASYAARRLGWSPVVKFEELVREMVSHELAILSGPGVGNG